MSCYRLLFRNLQNKSLNNYSFKYLTADKSSSSSSSSDSDNEKQKKKPKKTIKPVEQATKNDAIKKLNLLLKQMVEDDGGVRKSSLDLAKPKPQDRKRQNIEVKKEPNEKDLIKAVKDVAKNIGGDVKQTESELLSKLLNPVKDDVNVDSKQPVNLSDLLIGMKIDRTSAPAAPEVSRAHQVRQILKRGTAKSDDSVSKMLKRVGAPKRMPKIKAKSIDLFGSEPLGIFSNKTRSDSDEPILKTWCYLHQRELRLAVTHPPDNYFQEMILWTNQGKIWKFPIDNEQGMEEEKNVSFAEHIFLEKHLQPWCPNRGPIRHFMELVCVGLSKNPYISAQAKRDHLEWYKNYFLSKKELLEEIGAFPAENDKNNVKSLE